MKRMITFLLALTLLCVWNTALAAGTVTLDKARFTNVYGVAVTHEGNTVIAAGLREKENQTEGQNPTTAWLACIGIDGRILWEKREEKPGSRCLYSSPCVLKDGSVIALYIERTATVGGEKELNMLRSFSPKGDITGELKLDSTYHHLLSTESGLLVSYVDFEKPRPYPRHVTLYGASLKPVWTLEGISIGFRHDTAVSDGEGMTLLYRFSSNTDQIDQVRLARIDGQGKILWTRILAETQMGYMGLKMDANGNRIVFMNGWAPDGGQTTTGKLLCIDSMGNELWNKPVALPEEDSKFELSDFWLLEEDYLLMGLVKTMTCVRLYRLSADGTFSGTTDHFVHEETAYSIPSFMELGGVLYACSTEREHSKATPVLMPLTIPGENSK